MAEGRGTLLDIRSKTERLSQNERAARRGASSLLPPRAAEIRAFEANLELPLRSRKEEEEELNKEKESQQ